MPLRLQNNKTNYMQLNTLVFVLPLQQVSTNGETKKSSRYGSNQQQRIY